MIGKTFIALMMRKVTITTFLLLFLITDAYGQAPGRRSISIGTHLASVGNRSSIINEPFREFFPYSGLGITIDYSRKSLIKFNNLDTVIPTNKRWYLGTGVQFNYTRYGIIGSVYFPVRRDYACNFNNLYFSIKQEFSFLLTRNIITTLSIIPGYRISTLHGDTIASDIYGLRKQDGSANLRNLTCDLGVDFAFKIIPRLYFNLGYVNGLTNIIKEDANKYPVLREFYPYLKITKFI